MTVRRITPQMGDAWVTWNPGFEPDPQLTPKQSAFVRAAFLGGWDAAIQAATAVADKWRDENKASAAKARKSAGEGARGMAEMLDGAAIECNAVAGELRTLASAETPQ